MMKFFVSLLSAFPLFSLAADPILVDFVVKDFYSRSNEVSCWKNETTIDFDHCDLKKINCNVQSLREARAIQLNVDEDTIRFYSPSRAYIAHPLVLVGTDRTNVSHFYNFHKGQLRVKRGYQEKLLSLVGDSQNPIFEIIGECAETLIRGPVGQYLIYQRPDAHSDQLGTIHFNMWQGKSFLTWMNQARSKQAFTANLSNGPCGWESHYYHQVKAKKGSWVNLGEGPWGKNGWTRMKTISLYSDEAPLFKVKNLTTRLKIEDNQIYAVEQLFHERPKNHIDKKILLNSDEIFDNNGNIKLMVDCEQHGC